MTPWALVVDDSMLIRHTVCRFLELRGFAVKSASNGIEALEVLAGARPDLIVTDMMMPGMTGGELISKLKDNPATAGIPVIVLVAPSSRGRDAEAEKRAQSIIYKDIDINEQLDRALAMTFRN